MFLTTKSRIRYNIISLLIAIREVVLKASGMLPVAVNSHSVRCLYHSAATA